MVKSERQTKLLQILKSLRCAKSMQDLAQRFGCSDRTIRRDIEELITRRGMPIFIHDNQVRPDASHSERIEVEGYWFTTEEMKALMALNHLLGKLSNGLLTQELAPFAQRIDTLLGGKAQAGLVDKVKLIEIAGRQVAESTFTQVTQALYESKQLHIQFWNRETDEISERTISPRQLVRYRDRWLVDAWCHLRQDIRSFSLEAIQHIQLLDKQAQLITKQQLEQHFENSYGIFAGDAEHLATLKFTPYLARWIKDETWHPQQIGQWLEDGSYQLQLPYQHDIELLQDILKYGDQVEVIAPPDLRQKMLENLRKTHAMYSSDKICH